MRGRWQAPNEACQHYYEALLGVTIDSSGKDPGRLCFVSWDEDIYIKEEEEEEEEEMEEKEGKSAKVIHMVDDNFTHPEDKKTPAEVDDFVIHHVDDFEGKKEDETERSRKGTYNKLYRARQQVDSTMEYKEGNRNNYIYLFAHFCRNKNVTQEDVLIYCKKHFSDLNDIERRQIPEEPPYLSTARR